MTNIIDKTLLKSYFKSPFNIKEIISYIDETDSIYEYEYLNIKVIVYYRKKKDNLNFDLINKVIKRGTLIIKDKNFKIILLPTNAKKEFNKDNSHLSVKNVNSGFTYINKNEIFIFRKEEFPKVIIHELIHHDKKIHNDYISFEDNKKLYSHFKLHPNSKLILNEAIIELWATIIHLSFISKEYDIDYNELIKIEILYSLFKCFQISKLINPNSLYYDECNIFAYIIFKTIFLYHFIEFKKIYTFPYNNNLITNFLISHSFIKKNLINPSINFKGKIIKRPINSLCFMLLSDL